VAQMGDHFENVAHFQRPYTAQGLRKIGSFIVGRIVISDSEARRGESYANLDA